jgi:Fur family transcriptional regulator, ferric uptake regulator
MKKSASFDAPEVLQDAGFKVTPLRVLLLEVLHDAPKPLPVSVLVRKTKRVGADSATVYRALSAFVEKGIVKCLSLEKDKTSYEYILGKGHVHHVVCDSCGTIESISFCMRNIHASAAAKSKQFKLIKEHSLEFFGTCRKCVRAVR